MSTWKRIGPKEIQRRQDDAKKRPHADWREEFEVLSPTEIDDLRASLREVQMTAQGPSGVRALRMIALLDWYAASRRQRASLEQAIDAAGELSDEVQGLVDEFGAELKRDRTSALADVISDLPRDATREQLLDEVDEYVRGAFEKAQKAVELHLRALEALRHG